MSAKTPADCPDWELPEVAFIGRSNVGKSSMINMLASKEGLAKVSATPGKTRLLNFFVFDEKWCLVDLPGYGFAKVAREEKFEFNKAAGDYIASRENLSIVFVLIDSRLTPQRIDLDFLNWLKDGTVSFALIFTKADKQSSGKTKENVEGFMAALDEHGIDRPGYFISSSKKGLGRSEVLRFIQARVT
jgi:GTP-binding protein